MTTTSSRIDHGIGDDINKPRGLLVAYSTLLLLLWYFSADLKSLSFLGNAINLRANTNNIWLISFIANCYLIIRFYSNIPKGSFRFDAGMHEIYDSTLISFVKFFYHSRFYDEFHRWQQKTYKFESSSRFYEKIKLSGDIPCHKNLDLENTKNKDINRKIHELDHKERNTVSIHMTYGGIETTEKTTVKLAPWPNHTQLKDFTPPAWFCRLVLIFTLVRGFFVRPWFTDLLFPLAIGSLSAAVAFGMWIYVNWMYSTTLKCWM
ncbi:hypothetical protein [Pseudomonas fluorescens]|uniref:hypothetical protein n=1 Tax=Pseudomonas fluorescens TaxID=294 RepID=UPI00117A833B|nr:hypothetical protein [Pseudomonas fluorescens]